MPNTPLVSVILPARNAGGTIARALESAADQTYANLEIVLVDDCSDDETGEIARTWNRLPITALRLDRQSGAAAARNRGIELARGDYIAFLDSDDEWLPEKTALQMAALLADPALSFISCESWSVGGDGRVHGILNAGRTRAAGPDAWKTLLHHPCIATPSVIARRALVLSLGGFNTRLAIAEDQDLWIRLALAGPVAHLPRELVRVHDRPDSLSKREYRNTAAITLPMILGHLQANRDRLTAHEARTIRAARYAALGRNAYLGGHLLQGAALLLKAAALGHEPFSNLAYPILSSPPARRLKRRLRGRTALVSNPEAPAEH
jgi:glycosyltransferase involved in cell wall biosynthesis